MTIAYHKESCSLDP